MHSTRNIVNIPTTGSATAQPAGNALSQNDILEFLQTLSSQSSASQATTGTASAAANSGTARADLTAKITALLESDPAAAQKLQATLQAAAPQAQASGAIQPALTSDLASQLATLLQGQDQGQGGDLMQQLQSLFNDMQANDLSATDLSAFRADAIKLMQGMGMSDEDIRKTLEKFASSQDLTAAQTAQLAAPLPQAPQAAAPAQNDMTQDAKIDAAKPQTPAQQQSAQENTAQKGTAQENATQEQTAQRQSQPAAQQPAPRQDASNPAPQPKADAAQTSHIAIVNSLSAQDGTNSFDSNAGGGQSFAQDGSAASAQGLTGVTAAANASTGSFVNYLNNSPQAAQATTMQMVAMQVQKNIAGNVSTFTMQLNPAELGGLEIRLKFGKDGLMKAHLIADKPETLNMLQKDSSALHRVLQGAGLDADDSALSFDLRQQDQQQGDARQSGGNNRARGYGEGLDDMISDNAIQAKIAVASAGYIRQGGVNIMV